MNIQKYLDDNGTHTKEEKIFKKCTTFILHLRKLYTYIIKERNEMHLIQNNL